MYTFWHPDHSQVCVFYYVYWNSKKQGKCMDQQWEREVQSYIRQQFLNLAWSFFTSAHTAKTALELKKEKLRRKQSEGQTVCFFSVVDHTIMLIFLFVFLFLVQQQYEGFLAEYIVFFFQSNLTKNQGEQPQAAMQEIFSRIIFCSSAVFRSALRLPDNIALFSFPPDT